MRREQALVVGWPTEGILAASLRELLTMTYREVMDIYAYRVKRGSVGGSHGVWRMRDGS